MFKHQSRNIKNSLTFVTMEKTLEKVRWSIDPMHSEIQFKVKHLVISTVTGQFNEFSATMESHGEDFAGADVQFEAAIASITTANEQRDGHLKSADFFDAEQFPHMTFRSTAFTNVGGNQFELAGDLTIRDQTHPVTLQVEYGGTMVDPYGQTKAGFELQGKISRKQFQLLWDGRTEAGNVVVSDEVRLLLNVQMTKSA